MLLEGTKLGMQIHQKNKNKKSYNSNISAKVTNRYS